MAVNHFAFFILLVTLALAQPLNAQGRAQRSLLVGTWKVKQVMIDGADMVAYMQAQMEEAITRRNDDQDVSAAQRKRMEEQLHEQLKKATQMMQQIRYEFRANGTYHISGGGNNEQGTWKLTVNNTRLTTINAHGREDIIAVEKLTTNILQISQTKYGQLTVLVLERVQ